MIQKRKKNGTSRSQSAAGCPTRHAKGPRLPGEPLVTTQLRGVRFSIQSAFIFPQMRRFRCISDILQYIYITMRARSLSHLCADHGRFFRTVPALFLSYLTARSCTDLAFLVATGPTPGLCRGVETGPGVALVWEKWSRRSAETPLQNRFRTLGGPIDGALRDL